MTQPALSRLRPRWEETPPRVQGIELRTTREAADVLPSLDVLGREGARRLLVAALEAEVASYIDTHAGERDAKGKRLVVHKATGVRGSSRWAPARSSAARRGTMRRRR